MDGGREALVRQHFDELVQAFSDSGLELGKDESGYWVVTGDLHFSASYEKKETVEDTFSIQLLLPHDYPQSPPQVQEVGGRIPRDMDNHVIPKTGNLCLAAPQEVRNKFLEKPSLLHFAKELVVPFLYAFSYQERFGERPWGELSHGGKGILEHYQEIFDEKDLRVVLRLLKILADDKYRGHLSCPCGSGAILRRCHGEKLRELMQAQPPECFLFDVKTVLSSLSKEEIKLLSTSEIPAGYLNHIRKAAIRRNLQTKVEC